MNLKELFEGNNEQFNVSDINSDFIDENIPEQLQDKFGPLFNHIQDRIIKQNTQSDVNSKLGSMGLLDVEIGNLLALDLN